MTTGLSGASKPWLAKMLFYRCSFQQAWPGQQNKEHYGPSGAGVCSEKTASFLAFQLLCGPVSTAMTYSLFSTICVLQHLDHISCKENPAHSSGEIRPQTRHFQFHMILLNKTTWTEVSAREMNELKKKTTMAGQTLVLFVSVEIFHYNTSS